MFAPAAHVILQSFVSAILLMTLLKGWRPSWPGRWVPVARSAGSFHVDPDGSGRIEARTGLRMMPTFAG